MPDIIPFRPPNPTMRSHITPQELRTLRGSIKAIRLEKFRRCSHVYIANRLGDYFSGHHSTIYANMVKWVELKDYHLDFIYQPHYDEASDCLDHGVYWAIKTNRPDIMETILGWRTYIGQGTLYQGDVEAIKAIVGWRDLYLTWFPENANEITEFLEYLTYVILTMKKVLWLNLSTQMHYFEVHETCR
jgi:hypothetical protein